MNPIVEQGLNADIKRTLNIALGHYKGALGEDCKLDDYEVKAQITRIEFILVELQNIK